MVGSQSCFLLPSWTELGHQRPGSVGLGISFVDWKLSLAERGDSIHTVRHQQVV